MFQVEGAACARLHGGRCLSGMREELTKTHVTGEGNGRSSGSKWAVGGGGGRWAVARELDTALI
jgi:hypothetical protein